MKRIALAAAILACASGAALAQVADPPKMKCEPTPEWPGRHASNSQRGLFEREMKGYKDCVNKYLEDRKASLKAHEAAANAAIEEHNAVMKKVTDASGGTEKDKDVKEGRK